MEMKGQAGDALLEFIHDVGISIELHTDDVKEQMSANGKWQQVNIKWSQNQM